MHKILTLILKNKDGKCERGNKYLEKQEVSTLPRINEHIIINKDSGQELYKVTGVLHKLCFDVEILAVYDGTGAEVQKRLLNN